MRLFIKLFISFWLTLILMGGMIAWIADQLRDSFDHQLPTLLERQIRERQQLADLLAQEGLKRLQSVLSIHAHKDQLMVLDDAGQEILGRNFPSPHEQMRHRIEQMRIFDPVVVQTGDGKAYRLYVQPPPRSLAHLVRSYPWGFVVMVLSSGGVVLLLALHFTLPIRLLRATFFKLAEGDISARCPAISKRIPDELSGLSRDFNFMANRLEQLFYAHKRLLTDISHELRSPLARMRIASALVKSGDQNSRENLDHLELEIERLDGLIGQILTLSRFEVVRDIKLDDWVDMIALIETVAANVRYEADQVNRQVELHLCEEVILKADGPQLRSALENVIRNALQHTPEKGTVYVAAVQAQKEISITVQDEGYGVPEDQLELIFKPFYRVSEAREPEQSGFGLGLAIAAQIIQHHGGSIIASNRQEGGLNVTIRLPTL